MFEALVFLNRDNFCGSMMTMQAKAYQTKTGQWAGASCINAEKVENEYCSKKITTENATDISNACKNIYHKQLYNNGAVSPEKAMKNLQKYFIKGTVPVVAGNDAQLMTDYMNAIALYNQRKYKQALEAFLDIQKRGGEGADLLNDIALTHYKLEEYSKCITICQKILKTPQYDEYAKACYNAGLAYEAQENYVKAEQNYEKALEYYNKYGIADADDNVDYKGIYKQAIKRVADAQKTTQDTKKQDKATKNVKGAPAKKTGAKGKKASLLLIGAASVVMAKKRRDRLGARTRIVKRTRAK